MSFRIPYFLCRLVSHTYSTSDGNEIEELPSSSIQMNISRQKVSVTSLNSDCVELVNQKEKQKEEPRLEHKEPSVVPKEHIIEQQPAAQIEHEVKNSAGDVCFYYSHVCFCWSDGFVLMFLVYLVFFNVVCSLSLGVGLCIISLWSGCARCAFCDECSLRCSWSRSIFVSSL